MNNIILIGYGYWGNNLLRNICSVFEQKNVFVHDLSFDSLSLAKKNFPKINIQTSITSKFLRENIDAAVIATPVSTHYEIAKKCLENHVNVLVEKPITTSVTQLDSLNEIALKNKLIMMSGHTFLFSGPVIKAKEIVSDKNFGEINFIYSSRIGFGKVRDDVDVMWNLAPHDLSIISYILDSKPIKLKKNFYPILRNSIADIVTMNISFKNKSSALIVNNWINPFKERKMIIYGSKQTLVYDDCLEDKLKLYDYAISFDDKSPIYKKGKISNIIFDKHEPLLREIEYFNDCIINSNQPITGYEHSKSIIQILEGEL